jgi:hypothetical protein
MTRLIYVKDEYGGRYVTIMDPSIEYLPLPPKHKIIRITQPNMADPTQQFFENHNSYRGETPNMGNRFSNGFRQVEIMSSPVYRSSRINTLVPRTNNMRIMSRFVNLS